MLLMCDAASMGVLSADLSNKNSMTASLLYNLQNKIFSNPI